MPPSDAIKGISRRHFGRYTLAAGGALMMAGCDFRLSGRFTSADTHVRDYPTVQAVDYFGKLLHRWSAWPEYVRWRAIG
jgi:hypothetical protein